MPNQDIEDLFTTMLSEDLDYYFLWYTSPSAFRDKALEAGISPERVDLMEDAANRLVSGYKDLERIMNEICAEFNIDLDSLRY